MSSRTSYTLKEALRPKDGKNVKDALLKSPEALFIELVGSIGVFDNSPIGKKYLKREDSDWEDNQNFERGRARNSNIDAVNTTLDIASETKHYSALVVDLVDFEKNMEKVSYNEGCARSMLS